MTYAQIDSNDGIVLNIIVAEPTDYFNPMYIYVNVTGAYCLDGAPIQIGCTYDGQDFHPITLKE